MLALRPSVDIADLRPLVTRARERLARVRAGERDGLELGHARDWPEPWLAAALAAGRIESDLEIGVVRLLVLPRALPPVREAHEEELAELLARAEKLAGVERVALLESAWRLLPVAELAGLVVAADAGAPASTLSAPKRRSDVEIGWGEPRAAGWLRECSSLIGSQALTPLRALIVDRSTAMGPSVERRRTPLLRVPSSTFGSSASGRSIWRAPVCRRSADSTSSACERPGSGDRGSGDSRRSDASI
jgi:hypothetical protein